MNSVISKKINHLVVDKTDGEFESFDDFYRDNCEQIKKTLYRFGIQNDLDDIVQNIFMKAWNGLESFHKKANFKTWLTKIAINEAYNYFNKNKKYAPAELGAKHQENQTAKDANYENQELVAQALAVLSLDNRMIVVLSVIEGYKLKEIAETMKMPVGTIKSRLNRAKKKLLEVLTSLGVEL